MEGKHPKWSGSVDSRIDRPKKANAGFHFKMHVSGHIAAVLLSRTLWELYVEEITLNNVIGAYDHQTKNCKKTTLQHHKS